MLSWLFVYSAVVVTLAIAVWYWVKGKECNWEKAVLCAGILMTATSDAGIVWDIFASYGLNWFLILLAGVCWVVASRRTPKTSLVLALVAAMHLVLLMYYGEYGGQTFFGGAVVPVVAALCWAPVMLALLIVALVRRLAVGHL